MQIYKLIALTIFVLSSLANAQSTQEPQISFTEQKVGGVRIFTSSNGKCTIEIRNNGEVMVKVTGDNLFINKDLVAVEFITITEEYGVISFVDRRFAIHKNTDLQEKNVQLGGFNEFSKKYRDAVNALPNEVRKLFHGFFDIY